MLVPAHSSGRRWWIQCCSVQTMRFYRRVKWWVQEQRFHHSRHIFRCPWHSWPASWKQRLIRGNLSEKHFHVLTCFRSCLLFYNESKPSLVWIVQAANCSLITAVTLFNCRFVIVVESWTLSKRTNNRTLLWFQCAGCFCLIGETQDRGDLLRFPTQLCDIQGPAASWNFYKVTFVKVVSREWESRD